jgi:hypothetical protein
MPKPEARGTTVKSSVKPSHAANDNLIDRTREIWKLRLGRELSREDARQIVESVAGFFAILTEWSRAGIPLPANDTTKAHDTWDPGEVTDES